jgi:hypothetical protein
MRRNSEKPSKGETMKIQNTEGKEITVSDVASLPAEGDGETAEEILASLPDMPVCVKCKKKAAEVNSDGFCCVCQPPLPHTQPAVPRPSLAVETDVNRNLRPRLMAHIGRMRAWDLRELPVDDAQEFTGALSTLASTFTLLERCLDKLALRGFVAKTTPVTRIAAKLYQGSRVSLREDKLAEFSTVYTQEQLEGLTVGRLTPTHAQLLTSDGESIGLVKLIHVVP